MASIGGTPKNTTNLNPAKYAPNGRAACGRSVWASSVRVRGNAIVPAKESAVMHARGGVTGEMLYWAFSGRISCVCTRVDEHHQNRNARPHLFFEGCRYKPSQLHKAVVDAIATSLLDDLQMREEGRRNKQDTVTPLRAS